MAKAATAVTAFEKARMKKGENWYACQSSPIFRLLQGLSAQGLHCGDDASHSQDERPHTEFASVFRRFRYDVPGGGPHPRFEFFRDVFGGPVEVRIVLHLFEVADGDSSGVREDVGDYRNAFLEQYGVRFRRSGSVGEFEHEFRPDLRRVVGRYPVFERGGNEDVDVEFQEVVNGDFFRTRIFRYRLPVALQFGDDLVVEPFRMPYRSFRIRYGYDFRSGGMEYFDHRESGVSGALHRHGLSFKRLSDDLEIFRKDEEAALRSRTVAAFRTARGERLSRKRPRGPFSGEARIFVDHPGHDFRIGVHVRRGDVGSGAQVSEKPVHVCPGKSFEFFFGEFRRIYDDSAFSAAERQIEHCGFHAHPCGERHYFVFVHARMETYAALVRSSYGGVLRAVARKGPHASVVHFEDEVRFEHAFRFEEFGYGIGIEFREGRRVEHLLTGVFERGFRIRHGISHLG